MKRRSLLKGAIIGGIAASSAARTVIAAMKPALSAVNATTLGGSEVMLSESAVSGLQSGLRGTLLQAQDQSYDAARSLWNAMIDHHPALIAQCTSPEDVAAAVRFGREHNLLTSVRCGGHSFTGKSVAQNGLMIDLGFMHNVDVDTGRKTASVGGGARLGHVDMATLEHNLITTVGTDSDTGAGGLTLGGGLGRLNRNYGLTIDNLLSAEIVTADGEIRQVSANEEPDLFWAIRGGGGNFGVATRFDYQLHDFNPVIYGGDILYSWDQRHELLRFIADFAPATPHGMHLAPALFNHPEQGPLIVVEACYDGDHKTGEKLLAPLRAFGKPLLDQIGPKPYISMQLTPEGSGGLSHYIKSGLVQELSTEVIEAIADDFPEMPGSYIFFQHLGGAVAQVGPQDTAFSHRQALFNIGMAASFKDPAEYPAYRKAIRKHWARLEPHTMGFYTNLMEKDQQRTEDNFTINLARLQRTKAAYDPDNFFRLNANITPAA
jgi:FAD/FMN-containing dehydrogenase